jgi:hypothetical protein
MKISKFRRKFEHIFNSEVSLKELLWNHAGSIGALYSEFSDYIEFHWQRLMSLTYLKMKRV